MWSTFHKVFRETPGYEAWQALLERAAAPANGGNYGEFENLVLTAQSQLNWGLAEQAASLRSALALGPPQPSAINAILKTALKIADGDNFLLLLVIQSAATHPEDPRYTQLAHTLFQNQTRIVASLKNVLNPLGNRHRDEVAGLDPMRDWDAIVARDDSAQAQLLFALGALDRGGAGARLAIAIALVDYGTALSRARLFPTSSQFSLFAVTLLAPGGLNTPDSAWVEMQVRSLEGFLQREGNAKTHRGLGQTLRILNLRRATQADENGPALRRPPRDQALADMSFHTALTASDRTSETDLLRDLLILGRNFPDIAPGDILNHELSRADPAIQTAMRPLLERVWPRVREVRDTMAAVNQQALEGQSLQAAGEADLAHLPSPPTSEALDAAGNLLVQARTAHEAVRTGIDKLNTSLGFTSGARLSKQAEIDAIIRINRGLSTLRERKAALKPAPQAPRTDSSTRPTRPDYWPKIETRDRTVEGRLSALLRQCETLYGRDILELLADHTIQNEAELLSLVQSNLFTPANTLLWEAEIAPYLPNDARSWELRLDLALELANSKGNPTLESLATGLQKRCKRHGVEGLGRSCPPLIAISRAREDLLSLLQGDPTLDLIRARIDDLRRALSQNGIVAIGDPLQVLLDGRLPGIPTRLMPDTLRDTLDREVENLKRDKKPEKKGRGALL